MSVEPISPAIGVATEEVPQFETPSVVPPTEWRFPISRGALLALCGLGVIALIPIPFGSFGYYIGGYALTYAMIGLSVTVVTGYAGLLSLMPYSFAGIGAVITGMAMQSWGWPFWLSIPLAAAATIPVSIVAGAIAVRLRGLYLAIATLTIASMLGETFFLWHSVTNGDSGWLISRPSAVTSDGMFYVLCLGAALFMVWMIEGLRTSRLGRAMLAVRDNEREAQALGINAYKTKLAAFVIGGIMAGVGGAFLAVLLKSVVATPVFSDPSLATATSILLIVLVVVGGINSPWGAFFGAIIFVVTQQVFAGAQFFGAFVGIYSALLLIAFMLFRPGGLLQIGREQLELIRSRPTLGVPLVVGITAIQLGLAYLFVRLH